MMEHWIEIPPDEVGSGPFVIYFLLASQHPPQPPTAKPLTNTSPSSTPTSANPLPPVFSPQEHIMVIRQYVCIGINQGKSPLQEL